MKNDKSVREFDFRRPNKLGREYVRALQIAQESLARGLTTQMSSALRAVTHAAPGDIQQRTYDEFLRSLGNPSLVFVMQMPPIAGGVVLAVPLSVAYAIVELQLGGTLRGSHPARALTDLEASVVRFFIQERFLPELRFSFDTITEVSPRIVTMEANPQFAQVATPADLVVVLTVKLRIDAVEENLCLCIPFSALEPVLEEHVGAQMHLAAAPDAAESISQLRDRVSDVPVVASARLNPTKMASQELFALTPGDVVRFPHAKDDPVSVFVDGVEVFLGSIGVPKGSRRVAIQVVSAAKN
jgi:flagellar motor switch protein FliM